MTDHDQHHPLHFISPDDERDAGALTIDERDTEGRVFDAIADMFLGPSRAEGDHREPDGKAHDGAWLVELLVMGHLPVRSRPWASQYAAAIAEEQGRSVALVRYGAGYASVELFGDARGALSLSVAPSFKKAVKRVRERASLCLVQVDDALTRDLARTGAFDAFTFLVGGNDAAVVDAYRAMKGIAQVHDGALPALRLGVMGTDGVRAEEAIEKLSDAARSFLDHDIASSLAIERMGPTGAVSVFGDHTELGVKVLAKLLFDEIVEPARLPDVVVEAASDPMPEAVDRAEFEEHTERVLPKRLGTGASGEVFLADKHPDLLAIVGGLEVLDIECPYDAETVLGVDREGALHVVRRCESDAEELLMSFDWGERHRSILERATNGRVREDLSVVAHAIIERGSIGDDVRAMLGDAARVHLLARIPKGARWMSREL